MRNGNNKGMKKKTRKIKLQPTDKLKYHVSKVEQRQIFDGNRRVGLESH